LRAIRYRYRIFPNRTAYTSGGTLETFIDWAGDEALSIDNSSHSFVANVCAESAESKSAPSDSANR
jgi:hypothetical protein